MAALRPPRYAERMLSASTQAINLSWLLKLRWGAIVGQAVTIAAVRLGMKVALPLGWLTLIVAVEAGSNLAVWLWARRRDRIGEATVAAVLGLDVLLLTGLLYFTGGPFNPFSFLYLVHIALAAVVLQPRWTWPLVGLAALCFGALFYDHVGLSLDGNDGGGQHMHHMRTHLEGMWVAFAVAAVFIVTFVQRVSRALARREQELAEAHAVTARHEKLAALATLAAGAAHELSTPLSSIAVAAKELERTLELRAPGDETAADARLIRQEVARCREILAQLAADAGHSAGEPIARTAVADLVAMAAAGLPRTPPVVVRASPTAGSVELTLPVRAVSAALRAVLKNGQQASGPTSAVELTADRVDGCLRFTVKDAGPGMSPDVLARAGEPFFTTKPPAAGMGLGLFLARTVLERLGGRLLLDSASGRGTTASLFIPVDGVPRTGGADVPG